MDWVEFPDAVLGCETVDLVALIVTLSWSRKRAVVWARSKDTAHGSPASWPACSAWAGLARKCRCRLTPVPRRLPQAALRSAPAGACRMSAPLRSAAPHAPIR